jgi:sulfatase modifying factor 1
VNVTWYAAVSLCRWLSASVSWARGARLPLEEEWEYTCRADTQSRYWRGEEEADLAKVGWYESNSENRTHRVGEKPANPWGLYDVHGNVWEWTLSLWTDSYEGREAGVAVNPATVEADDSSEPLADTSSGGGRVMRGGGFWDVADWARAACRNFRVPGVVNQDLGFRVLLPAVPESRL